MFEQEMLQKAINLAYDNVLYKGGKPFGCVITQNGKIIATGVNEVNAKHDITAHAEMQAIRQAGEVLQDENLLACELYASGEPCPMCQAAIYWAGIKNVYYAQTAKEAERIGFGTDFVLQQLSLPHEQKAIHFEHMIMDMTEKNPFALWEHQQKH